MTLGEKLRRTRQERGLTQKQLAGERITRNMLSQIENDLAQPSMRTLEYLADALGVEPGWLMMQEQSGDAQSALTQARELLREGAFAACLAALEPLSGEEALLMRAVCARSLAADALDDERFEEARRCAEQALSCSAQCLYPDAALQVSAAGILARCAAAEGSAAEADAAFETYRETYLRWQSGVGYHLTLARFDLEREHVQAAEREIWSITELPEASRAEYLILRGRIAARKEQYENAILYLKQAEEIEGLPKILRRELLMGLERCYKETEQYKLAYEYAAAQRSL